MGREFNKWFIAFLTPPFRAIGLVIGGLYKLIFGAADIRRAKKNEEHLAQDIRRDLFYLFSDYGATIVPNRGLPFPPAFDYAFVTAVIGNLHLVFSRGRGELNVEVAPKILPSDGYELTWVIRILSQTESIRRGALYDLVEVARLLKSHMGLLNDAFTPERVAITKDILSKASNCDQAATRQLELEINRRLYPNV